MTNSAHTILARVPFVERIRKNHGLEHATIHLLSTQRPRTSLAGRSDHRGFVLFGNVATEAVAEAAQAALGRMKNGEHELAVHPNCGTNFVTAGMLVGLVAFVGSFLLGKNWRTRLERLPLLVSIATMTLIFAHPLGMTIQREVTTTGQLGDLEIVSVTRHQAGRWTMHRVETRG